MKSQFTRKKNQAISHFTGNKLSHPRITKLPFTALYTVSPLELKRYLIPNTNPSISTSKNEILVVLYNFSLRNSWTVLGWEFQYRISSPPAWLRGNKQWGCFPPKLLTSGFGALTSMSTADDHRHTTVTLGDVHVLFQFYWTHYFSNISTVFRYYLFEIF